MRLREEHGRRTSGGGAGRSPAALSFALTLCLFSSCGRRNGTPACAEFEAMGETASVCMAPASAEALEAAREIAAGTMLRIDELLSVDQPKSEISALNRVAGTVRLPVSTDTHRILQLAREYNQLTDGMFDVTVAPLTYLWGFHSTNRTAQAPSPEMIESAMRGIGNQHVILDEHSAQLGSPYTRLDLGGIQQGYAVDISLLLMRQQGLDCVLVRLGDQARCLGMTGPDRPWTVEIPSPFQSSDPLGTLALTNGQASSTSSFGRHFITLNSERFAHIVDPRTGWPVHGMALTSVVAPTATMADALATALFVAGMKDAQAILERFPRCDAILVPDTDPLEIWITSRLRKQFTPSRAHADAVRVLNVVAAE